MKRTLYNTTLFVISVVVLLSPSEQSRRCECHQCTHIPSTGRRCECCVYMLHGKKRSKETSLSMITKRNWQEDEENYDDAFTFKYKHGGISELLKIFGHLKKEINLTYNIDVPMKSSELLSIIIEARNKVPVLSNSNEESSWNKLSQESWSS